MSRYKNKGFTLIEVLVVVVVIGILTAMSVGGYQELTGATKEASVQKQMFDLGYRLERHKTVNLSYAGFTETATRSPLDPSKALVYNITIVDTRSGFPYLNNASATGEGWAIKAVPVDPKLRTFLMRSDGLQCSNSNALAVSYVTCGNGAWQW